MFALLDVAEERQVDAFGWDGAVADDFTACFGEEGGEEDEESDAEDGEEPEYGSPAEKLGKSASQKRSKGGPDEQAGHGVAHISASFGGGGDIRDNRHGQGDGGAAAGGLDGAQNEKSGVVGL